MGSTSPVFYDSSQPLPKIFTKERLYENTLPRTIVAADVWIGQGAMIKAGVKIGIGSVIGAGAVVTRDVPPYTISAGNPCKAIRKRFDEDTVERLIASRWWELGDKELESMANLFSDLPALLKKLEAKNEKYPY